MARAVCPCGPCENVLDVDSEWRCSECGKNLVGKSSSGRDDRVGGES